MPYRRTSAVQARLDAQREAIISAAIALLSERGYQGLSIAAVAAEAGVAAGSVYRHFSGKTELVTEIFRDVVGREVAAVASAADTGGSAVDRVTAAVETFAGRAMKNPKLAYALLAEPVDAAVDTERMIFRKAFAHNFARAIGDGVAAATLPPQDPDLTAAALVGAVAETLVGPLASDPHPEIVIPELVAFSLRALGVCNAHP
ncbi:TetR/AcrR family transcriptional regulator [Skermania sp. ID1734]|uniref:TetR/AcrR family transcriptional regulator n=1 Tax=Skermania sp. ID1734 TaxID=2597516 RepID=UPI00117D9E4A|nr:TetR/AcrR family transcriptional regulator [Skermania sp. ID1734]TSD99683.1 TetR/AcrR family transcriptional regulator [Skermania sp. ID1734]